MNWIKDFFHGPKFFELEQDKQYSLRELIDILKNKTLSHGQGNVIVLYILDKLVQERDEK